MSEAASGPDREAGARDAGAPASGDQDAGARPRVGVSSCLLGEPVRFNGGHSRSRFLTDELGPYVSGPSMNARVASTSTAPPTVIFTSLMVRLANDVRRSRNPPSIAQR